MIENETNLYDNGNVAFIRRIDQFSAKSDALIARDDGIPTSQLDFEEICKMASETVCRGTYSHFCKTIDGQKTHIALEVIKGPCLK